MRRAAARRGGERNDGAQEGTIPGGPKGYIDMLGTMLALGAAGRRKGIIWWSFFMEEMVVNWKRMFYNGW